MTGIFIAIRSRDFTNYWTFERVSRCRSQGFERACTRVINADTRLTFINAVFARSFRKIPLTSTLYIYIYIHHCSRTRHLSTVNGNGIELRSIFFARFVHTLRLLQKYFPSFRTYASNSNLRSTLFRSNI